jgi:hypothetical protein
MCPDSTVAMSAYSVGQTTAEPVHSKVEICT